MKSTGLKFMLDAGAFMMVVLPEQTAKAVITGFQEGKLTPIIGGTTLESALGKPIDWAIEVKAIRAVHSFDPSNLVVQQQGQAPGPWAKSGYNPGVN